jgi:hypothetical protein
MTSPEKDPWADEPTIVINGTRLTTSQAMLVRVALGSFALSLRSGLGDDLHGKRMTSAFLSLLGDLTRLMETADGPRSR